MEKIEKLELKHLCGYLPYGLKVRMPAINKSTCRRYEMGTVGCLYSDCSIVCHDVVNSTPDWYKPILLPISALTEPMEDGSVPIVELAKIAYKWQKWDEKRINKNNGVLEGSPYDFWFSEEKREFMLCDGGGYLHINNQLQLFEYLYSHHFDIYGLITAGLAIDKRTLNKTQ